jgi:hypothetical protein
MPHDRRFPYPGDIQAAGHDLFVYRTKCRHCREADLAELIRRRLGNRSPCELRWKCGRCGRNRVVFTISAERRRLGDLTTVPRTPP